MSALTLRQSWLVRLNSSFTAYVGGTTPSRAKCLRGVIEKLQHGTIDLHQVDHELYSVWACDVIVMATPRTDIDTVLLIDVLEPDHNAV